MLNVPTCAVEDAELEGLPVPAAGNEPGGEPAFLDQALAELAAQGRREARRKWREREREEAARLAREQALRAEGWARLRRDLGPGLGALSLLLPAEAPAEFPAAPYNLQPFKLRLAHRGWLAINAVAVFHTGRPDYWALEGAQPFSVYADCRHTAATAAEAAHLASSLPLRPGPDEDDISF